MNNKINNIAKIQARAKAAARAAESVNAEIERVLLGNICHVDSDFWQPDPATARVFYEAIMARSVGRE